MKCERCKAPEKVFCAVCGFCGECCSDSGCETESAAALEVANDEFAISIGKSR